MFSEFLKCQHHLKDYAIFAQYQMHEQERKAE